MLHSASRRSPLSSPISATNRSSSEMWKYWHHRALERAIRPIAGFLEFLLRLSWLYAHYRNGHYPNQFPDQPRDTFQEWSLWRCIKESWSSPD